MLYKFTLKALLSKYIISILYIIIIIILFSSFKWNICWRYFILIGTKTSIKFNKLCYTNKNLHLKWNKCFFSIENLLLLLLLLLNYTINSRVLSLSFCKFVELLYLFSYKLHTTRFLFVSN